MYAKHQTTRTRNPTVQFQPSPRPQPPQPPLQCARDETRRPVAEPVRCLGPGPHSRSASRAETSANAVLQISTADIPAMQGRRPAGRRHHNHVRAPSATLSFASRSSAGLLKSSKERHMTSPTTAMAPSAPIAAAPSAAARSPSHPTRSASTSADHLLHAPARACSGLCHRACPERVVVDGLVNKPDRPVGRLAPVDRYHLHWCLPEVHPSNAQIKPSFANEEVNAPAVSDYPTPATQMLPHEVNCGAFQCICPDPFLGHCDPYFHELSSTHK